jgi:hypothetical protein
LGELHIAGKNEWSPFEQAAHLYDMSEVKGFAIELLTEMYRLSKSTVIARKRAYKLMVEEYLPLTKGDLSVLDRWSYFEEFMKKCKPKADTDGRELEEKFVRWMVAGKFKKGEQVRWLPQILANEQAIEVLEKQDAEAAWRFVEDSSPELGSKVFKAVVAAAQALKTAPMTEVDLVREGDEGRLRELEGLQQALAAFLKQAGR